MNSTEVRPKVVPTVAGEFMLAMQLVPAVNVAFAVQKADVDPEMPTAQFADVVIVVFTRAEAPAEMKLVGTFVVVVVVRPPVESVTVPVSTAQ